MENLNTTITLARLEDAFAILQVRKTTWLATYPNKAFGITKSLLLRMKLDSAGQLERVKRRIRMRDDKHHYWVARHKGRAVGFLRAIKHKDKNYIGSFYILPKFQGQGLGTKMMRAALRWLGGEKKIILKVAIYNTRAINFYRKFGFLTGRKCFGPRLLDGRRSPSLIMFLPSK